MPYYALYVYYTMSVKLYIYTIQVAEGRKYFPRGLQGGQHNPQSSLLSSLTWKLPIYNAVAILVTVSYCEFQCGPSAS